MTRGFVNTQYPSFFLFHRARGQSRATFPVATPGGIFSSTSPIARQENVGNHLRHRVRSDVRKNIKKTPNNSHAYLSTYIIPKQVHVMENCKIKKEQNNSKNHSHDDKKIHSHKNLLLPPKKKEKKKEK